MKKFLSFFCLLSLLFIAGCGDDNPDNGNNTGDNTNNGNNTGDNTNNGDNNNNGNSSLININENLLPIPDAQNNTEGAQCDETTFVESCSGEKAVYCYDGEVVVDDCSSNSLKCLATREKDSESGLEYNFAYCYEPCQTAKATATYCTYDPEYYDDMLVGQECINTSKGLLFIDTGFDYCGTPCTNGTCQTQVPCGKYDEGGDCTGNNAYFCDGDFLHVIVCGEELTCSKDEELGYADCF